MAVFIHEVIIDTSPFTNSFGNGYVVSLCHYSYEICQLKIRAYPFDTGIRRLPREDRKEVIGIGVRCNPLRTEEILIEGCDAMGSSSEPTIGESCGGYTRCDTLAWASGGAVRGVRIGDSDR